MSLLLLFRPIEGAGPPPPVLRTIVYRAAIQMDKPEGEAMTPIEDVYEDIFGTTPKRSYLGDEDTTN